MIFFPLTARRHFTIGAPEALYRNYVYFDLFISFIFSYRTSTADKRLECLSSNSLNFFSSINNFQQYSSYLLFSTSTMKKSMPELFYVLFRCCVCVFFSALSINKKKRVGEWAFLVTVHVTNKPWSLITRKNGQIFLFLKGREYLQTTHWNRTRGKWLGKYDDNDRLQWNDR